MAPSWINIPRDSPFSLVNIPFGIISTAATHPVPAIAIGEYALNLSEFASRDGFSQLPAVHNHLNVFHEPTLNAFAALGRPIHREVREYLQQIFHSDTPYPSLLKDNASLQKAALVPLKDVTNHLPLKIGDYTDFYAGLNHAFNVGCLFRGPDNALQPNYKHLPVGYHGRASSVVVSGTPIHRPNGQILVNPTAKPQMPVLSPCKKLDIELELGAFVAKPNKLGQPISIDDAADHLFGVVLMNDWSARDIQAWEYVPLGPFNAKNFGTSISPWVVLMDALEPFLSKGLDNGKREHLLPYLREKREANVYNIRLHVELKAGTESTIISQTDATNLLFSFPQMLTHHTITGCNLSTGDLLGSGTISGTEPGTEGSLLEQTSGGKTTVKLHDGLERKFLEDGDEITLRGLCGEEGSFVGFGECVGKILPAVDLKL